MPQVKQKMHMYLVCQLSSNRNIYEDLHDTARRGDLKREQEILTDYPQLTIDFPATANGSSALLYTCQNYRANKVTGHIELISLLLNSMADPLLANNAGQTPASSCIVPCSPLDDYLGKKLRNFAANNQLEEAEKLLQQRPSVIDQYSTTSSNGGPISKRTALHWASLKGYPDMIKLLLKFAANQELKDSSDKTPKDLYHDKSDTNLWRCEKMLAKPN